MDRQKLIHQLFIGKVADVLGIEKTTELLKEAKEAFAIPVVSIELKGYFKKGEFVIYKSVLRAQVIDELETGLIEIKAIGYGVLEVDPKHLELE